MWVISRPASRPPCLPSSPAAIPSRVALPTWRLPCENLQTNCKIHLRTQAVQRHKAQQSRGPLRAPISHAPDFSFLPRAAPPAAISLGLLTHKSPASAARELSNGKQRKNIPTVCAKSFRLSIAEHKTWNLAVETVWGILLRDTLRRMNKPWKAR